MHFFFSFCELSCARGCTKCTGLLTWPLVAIVHRDWMGRARALCVSSELLLDAFAKLKILHVNVCRVVGGSLRRDGEVWKRLGSVLAESRWFCFAVLRGRIAFFFFFAVLSERKISCLLTCSDLRAATRYSSHSTLHLSWSHVVHICFVQIWGRRRNHRLRSYVAWTESHGASKSTWWKFVEARGLTVSSWELTETAAEAWQIFADCGPFNPPLCLHDGPNGPRGISFINRMIS